MLRNINNFFNIIKEKRVKKNLKNTDMIPIGSRDTVNPSKYNDAAISWADFQLIGAGAQGPPGVAGPAGATGPEGPAGPVGAAGLVFRSTWDPATSYVVGDVVFYNGSSYVCSNNITSATPPDADTANWDFLALQGLQGPAGGGFSVSDASRITSVPTGGAQFAFRQLLIPANSFGVGDVFNVIAAFIAVPGTGTFTYETYINTAPGGLGGATPLFDIKMLGSRRYMNTIQTFYIDGVGPTTGPSGSLNTITSGFSQYNNAASNLSIDWTVDQYFIIAGRNASTRDVINVGAKIF